MMISKDFELSSDYIELYKLLKLLRIAQSGAHAKLLIEDGEVILNNSVENRKRAKLRPGDIVKFGDTEVRIKRSKG